MQRPAKPMWAGLPVKKVPQRPVPAQEALDPRTWDSLAQERQQTKRSGKSPVNPDSVSNLAIRVHNPVRLVQVNRPAQVWAVRGRVVAVQVAAAPAVGWAGR